MKLHFSKSLVIAFLLLAAADSIASAGSNTGSMPIGWNVDDIDFNFKTTKSFDKAALLEVMFISKTKDFTQDELEKDRQRIKKFYFDNGFFDAIVDTAVTYNKEEDNVNIEIIIIENNRYTIKEIIIKGLDGIEPRLKESVGSDRIIKPDDNYVKGNLTKETNRILDILQNNGYLNARVDTIKRTEIAKYAPGLQAKPEFKNKVRVTINFTGVNKVYYFGTTKINIIENKYSLDSSIVSREIKFHEGDLFSKEQLVESERNLSKFALIQQGRIKIDTVIENEARVNLSVNITLNKKYQVTPSIVGKDIAGYFYFGGALQYDDKNFFGGGRVFSIKLEPLFHSKDINEVSLTAGLFQPYLFRDNVTADVSSSLLYKNFDISLQNVTLSNTITLNYYLRKYVFYGNLLAQLNVDLVREKYKQDYVDNLTGTYHKAGSIVNSLNSVIGFTAIHNNTNNVFNPSAGFFHSFTLEDAGFLPSLLNKISGNIQYSQYFKFYMANSFYIDLSSGVGRRIFAFGSKIGDIVEFGSNPNIISILPQYKFFSGGGNSVRGWYPQQNGILAVTKNGGKFLFEGSLEYRWMMFADNTNFLKDFGMVYFFDYGNVWESHIDFHPRQIALAVGFGFRYYTFVGPIRIDFGIRMYDPNAPEGKQWIFRNYKDIFNGKSAIQFGLGNAF